MDLILITNDPARAAIAANAGVVRIMVDLEIAGKRERQGHLDTVISAHTLEDVARIHAAVPDAALLVRTDPWSATSPAQVDACIAAGADILMLPMFKTRDEVAAFAAAVAGRARTCLLLETPAALETLDTILDVPGVDELHVGLNDLHLATGKTFMFELLADGTVESVAERVLARGVKFGFGGVARIGGGPLRPELVLSEHVRLGSTQVILSRDFQCVFDAPAAEPAFIREIRAVRATLASLAQASAERLEANAAELRRKVGEIVASGGPRP